jgi:hypothetical protein
MDSNWKLLRGECDWKLLHQSLFNDYGSYQTVDSYPKTYPCLVQVHSTRDVDCALLHHKWYFVYVNDASFLMDFISGKID